MDVFVGEVWPWLAHLALVGIGLVLAIIDQRTHRLPDAIVLPTWWASATYFTVVAGITGNRDSWERSIGVTAVTVLLLWLMAELPGYPLGFGDVKLGGVIATHLGWHGVATAFLGLMSAFFFAGVWALVAWLFGKRDLSSHIPLGPWLIGGFGWALTIHRAATETAGFI